MGFDKNGTRFLLYAKRKGVDFQQTLTLGRQGLHLAPLTLADNLREFGYPTEGAQEMLTGSEGFAETFLRFLGAGVTDSLDASTYENATHLHDLNQPIPPEWHGKYSLVIDGGSLEHVFNFPTAVKNTMELVREGGHCLILTVCNNYLGHGFYQFSPELFYRIFSPENGFQVESMFFYTDAPKATWYAVSDPLAVKGRVRLHNAYSSGLFVLARKTAVTEIFKTTPMQSDYQWINWEKSVSESRAHSAAHRESPLAGIMPRGLVRMLLRWKYVWKSLRVALRDTGNGERRLFKKTDPLD